MSLTVETSKEIPATTAQVARASFRKGNKLMTLRDKFGPMYREEDFQDLYSWKGSEGISPVILASVTALQYMEGLSDQAAAEQVCARIDWKYLLGLDLDYAGFDASVLSEFRKRLIEKQADERLFEKPLSRMREVGFVKERGQQRTDSTHVLAAIRSLNRLELAGETVRQALNHLAVVGSNWLASWAPAEWIEHYSSRIEDAKLPKKESERKALIQTIGEDGTKLLTALYDEKTPDYLKLYRRYQDQTSASRYRSRHQFFSFG